MPMKDPIWHSLSSCRQFFAQKKVKKQFIQFNCTRIDSGLELRSVRHDSDKDVVKQVTQGSFNEGNASGQEWIGENSTVKFWSPQQVTNRVIIFP